MKKPLCIVISFCFVLLSAGQRRNLIFESNFDAANSISNWYERSLANTWSATICDTLKYAGRSGVRFELRKGVDTLFGVRAELGTEPQSQIGESWYGFANYFPAAYSPDPSGEIISQWQAKPDLNLGENWRSPPLALEIKNDRFYLAIRWSADPVNSNATSSIAYLDLGPVEHARWTDWVFYAKWRYNNTGSLKIWKNGTLIINRPNQPLGYNDVNYPYFKIGIYKWEWQGPSASTSTSRIYYADEVRIGNASATYYDVAPVYSRKVIMQGASMGIGQKESFNIYPNPVQNGFVFSVNNSLAGAMKVEILDLNGNPINQFVMNKLPGLSQRYVARGGLSTGKYILKASLANWSYQTVLITN